ncbi:MAG: hypothetical protein AAFZ80_05090 [Cyanobacteria bacterium P01_A01_bin.105]
MANGRRTEGLLLRTLARASVKAATVEGQQERVLQLFLIYLIQCSSVASGQSWL